MKNLDQICEDATKEVDQANSLDNLEHVRITYLGKKGSISELFKEMGKLAAEERKDFGQKINVIKEKVVKAIEDKKNFLHNAALEQRLQEEKVDITLPLRPENRGTIHPVSQVIEEITTLFAGMGFEVKDGPDIEEDFYNFTALNIPDNHPARQMHDTFYLEGEKSLLRTHTSPVQIRTMEKGKPPFRFIAPGRTYRCDSDLTHTPMFHQVEGLFIAEDIHMGHLKGCITEFIQTFFGIDDLPVRFRPSFFPFTEPSAEVDIGCTRKDGQLTIGAGDDWLEVMGCGMVHPNVLKNVNIDPEHYQGFAFGLGVERMAMLKYGINDLRTFFDPDQRWVDHYGFKALDIPSFLNKI